MVVIHFTANLKELKILRLQNRLTKKFKLALGNLLLESPSTPGLYSSFLCNKFRVHQNEECVTINPDSLSCNSDDIVLLAGDFVKSFRACGVLR